MKKVSKNFECFLMSFKAGLANANVIAAGIMLPVTANKKVLVPDNPNFNPSGIASFISMKGVIALKSTINSGAMAVIYACICFYQSLFEFIRFVDQKR